MKPSAARRVERLRQSWPARSRIGRGRQALSEAFLAQVMLATPTCKCCGCRLRYEGPPGSKAAPDAATLDRLRPDLGYQPWNVAIICWRCNSLKADLTVEDCHRIATYIDRYSPRG